MSARPFSSSGAPPVASPVGAGERGRVHPMIEIGHRDDNAGPWVPSMWGEPGTDRRVAGETTTIRTHSTSGDHRAGMWRSGAGMSGCDADGSCRYESASPEGDTAFVVLEGSGHLTVTGTGRGFAIGPGSIVIQPRGLALRWDLTGPSFRKLWVRWNGRVTAMRHEDLYVGSVDDDPGGWQPYEWVDEKDGLAYSCGHMLVLRSSSAGGTFRCGLWRSRPVDELGSAIDPTGCRPGRCTGHRIGTARGVGDETMLILEGDARLRDEDGDGQYVFRTGQIVAVSEGLNGRWTSGARWMKKFWVVTQAPRPDDSSVGANACD